MSDQTNTDRAEINRANAAKSTGPKTEAGKHKSSQNALRHALTGQVTILPWEDRVAHDTFCEAIVTHYGPEGALELQIAQSIAEDEWRLNRARAIEQNILSFGMEGLQDEIEAEHPEIHAAVTMAAAFMKDPNGFSRLSLYETRIHRNIRNSEQRLRTIQAERKEATKTAVDETEVLLKHAAASAQPYDPAPDFPPRLGFVFSREKVTALIDRKNRIHAARQHAWDTRERPEDQPDAA